MAKGTYLLEQYWLCVKPSSTAHCKHFCTLKTIQAIMSLLSINTLSILYFFLNLNAQEGLCSILPYGFHGLSVVSNGVIRDVASNIAKTSLSLSYGRNWHSSRAAPDIFIEQRLHSSASILENISPILMPPDTDCSTDPLSISYTITGPTSYRNKTRFHNRNASYPVCRSFWRAYLFTALIDQCKTRAILDSRTRTQPDSHPLSWQLSWPCLCDHVYVTSERQVCFFTSLIIPYNHWSIVGTGNSRALFLWDRIAADDVRVASEWRANMFSCFSIPYENYVFVMDIDKKICLFSQTKWCDSKAHANLFRSHFRAVIIMFWNIHLVLRTNLSFHIVLQTHDTILP